MRSHKIRRSTRSALTALATLTALQLNATAAFGFKIKAPGNLVPSVPLPGQLGNEVNKKVQDEAYRQLGEKLNQGLPAYADAKHTFKKVKPLKDFHPTDIVVHSEADLDKPLAPGDYRLKVRAYCLKSSIHRPSPGVPYTLTRLQGPQAEAVSNLLERGEEKHVDPEQLWYVANLIELGQPISKWSPQQRNIAQQLIPEYTGGLNGNGIDHLLDVYRQFQQGGQALHMNLPDPERFPLIHELRVAQQTVQQKTVTAQTAPDRLYEATHDPNDRTPIDLPTGHEVSPWVESPDRPGVFLRFDIDQGTVLPGREGNNYLNIRITKEALGGGDKSVKLAQATATAPTLRWLLTAVAGEAGTIGRLPAPALVKATLLVGVAVGAGAQLLAIMAEPDNGGNKKNDCGKLAKIGQLVGEIIEHSPKNPGELPADAASTFTGGKYRKIVLSQAVRLYRLFDGVNTLENGRYWTTMRVTPSDLQSPGLIDRLRQMFALPPVWSDGNPGNGLTGVIEQEFPAGTTLY